MLISEETKKRLQDLFDQMNDLGGVYDAKVVFEDIDGKEAFGWDAGITGKEYSIRYIAHDSTSLHSILGDVMASFLVARNSLLGWGGSGDPNLDIEKLETPKEQNGC